jgi:hypothetical protein
MAANAEQAPAALPRLERAMRGLIAVRPRDWNDSEDPELEAAWREAEDALAMAGLQAASDFVPGAPRR